MNRSLALESLCSRLSVGCVDRGCEIAIYHLRPSLRMNKTSQKIEASNAARRCRCLYRIMRGDEGKAVLSVCTDEVNHCHFEHIHVIWVGLFEVERIRKLAIRESY